MDAGGVVIEERLVGVSALLLLRAGEDAAI